MGLTDKLIRKTKLAQITQSIKKAIRDNNLVFIDDKTLKYTDKNGDTLDYTYQQWAIEFFNHAVSEQQILLVRANIGEKEIAELLSEQYKKQEAIKK